MAPDGEERKPLTAEQKAALHGLEHGLRFNTSHTTARELIAMGYAFSSFGHLAITEAGRIAARGRARSFASVDEHVSDLSAAVITDDPFAAPHRATAEPIAEEAPAAKLSPPSNSRERAQRAAGVASGKTGNWVNEAWVEAFIEAFDEPAE